MSNIKKEEIEDILQSALAAMEVVGLPIEKFVPFVTQPVLFSNPLKQKPNDVKPAPNNTLVFSSKKQKLTI